MIGPAGGAGRRPVSLLLTCVLLVPLPAVAGPRLEEQNEALFRALEQAHAYTRGQMDAVRAIFARSGFAGQGNPAVARHPLSFEECAARWRSPGAPSAGAAAAEPLVPDLPDADRFRSVCGARFMAPLYDPATEGPDRARVCIDQFEFPNIPCAYPVVWVRAREAALICQAIGKRLCDAHEWEGACAGRLLPPDYRFDLARGVDAATAARRMRAAHNNAHAADRRWSYGPEYRRGICATSGHKTPGCLGGGFERCGSNTFPAGAFPDCRSPLGVYDLHGNAAEHMNLPLDESQMASRGSQTLGVTEMKGSWFIFDEYRAHDDWCRWRAPYWHGGRVLDAASHANYHLGFRCCKDLAGGD